jgi:hypothetical protein
VSQGQSDRLDHTRQEATMNTITAEEIEAGDSIIPTGDQTPQPVQNAWTASDGMVYVEFTTGAYDQLYRDDVVTLHA